MGTFETKIVKCSLCGERSKQAALGSCSTPGEPDLDFRPSEPLRSTMERWLQECPYCGYISDDLRKWPRIGRQTLLHVYEQADSTLPRLAHAFQKRALYFEHVNILCGAIRAYLCAAWVCDDAANNFGANAMRAKCFAAVQRRLKHCGRKQWLRYRQLEADLLRRTENIEALRRMDTNDKRLDFATRELLLFQKELGLKRDFAAHSRYEIDLAAYEDLFEKRTSVRSDHALYMDEWLKHAISINEQLRANALEVLDALRPKELNKPYHEYDGVLHLHGKLPIDEDHPYKIKELAQAVNEEFLNVLESFVVPSSMLREAVTDQNKVCMAMLYQLYTSPSLTVDLKDHASAHKRIYVMRVDDPFSDDSYQVGFIEPMA